MITAFAQPTGGKPKTKLGAKTLAAGICFMGATLLGTNARAETDSLWYARLGAGAIEQKGLSGGPAFGFGLRYGLGRIALDASLFNFVLTKQGATFDNLSGSWLKLGFVYYVTPFASSSLYTGAAAAWGLTSAEIDNVHYSNAGLNFGLSVGYETMRTRTVRLFIQADADLPAYLSHGYVPVLASGNFGLEKDSIYTPTFVLSVGIGVGPARAEEPPKSE